MGTCQQPRENGIKVQLDPILSGCLEPVGRALYRQQYVDTKDVADRTTFDNVKHWLEEVSMGWQFTLYTMWLYPSSETTTSKTQYRLAATS
eukprot:5258902-Amphidinium_carterae.1